jgi:hypothetical protein
MENINVSSLGASDKKLWSGGQHIVARSRRPSCSATLLVATGRPAASVITARSRNDERYWTPREIASRWRVSIDMVIRLVEHEPDVLVLAHPSAVHRRRYRTLRIPHAVLIRLERSRSLVKRPQ